MSNAVKELVQRTLSEGNTIEVVFTKKDGTERTMRCTTNLNDVPSEKHPNGGYVDRSDVAKRVFDVDLQDWRSFRWDSLKEVRIDNLKFTIATV